jgi:hypothetical protein
MSPLPIKSQKSIVHNCLIEKNPNAYPLGFLLSLIPLGSPGVFQRCSYAHIWHQISSLTRSAPGRHRDDTNE